MEMEPTICELWDNLRKKTKQIKKYQLVFHEDYYDSFKSTFIDQYESICHMYMRPDKRVLDRHKVAAVTIISALQNKVITCDNYPDGYPFFLGCEMIATEVALAWMLDQYNAKLRAYGLSALRQYTMPEAYACETQYFEIFCRSLYYAQRDNYKLNPIDIAEKLFLLEYITMLSEDIPISALKE